jgi:hypothetical protein
LIRQVVYPGNRRSILAQGITKGSLFETGCHLDAIQTGRLVVAHNGRRSADLEGRSLRTGTSTGSGTLISWPV